jgi:hypothetical protein
LGIRMVELKVSLVDLPMGLSKQSGRTRMLVSLLVQIGIL